MVGTFGRSGRRADGLIGTWVKIPSLETVELLGHAGFDFVVIDMEHAPHSLEGAYRLVFAAQAMGMAALVRLPDRSEAEIQRLLDGGADGLLVPHVSDLETAQRITSAMVFAPEGTRGLGTTSRAGCWGLLPMSDYVRHGNERTLRIIQLEAWEVLQEAEAYLAIDSVSGVFVGLGDLLLSSGRKPADEETQAMVERVAQAARAAGKVSGIAASDVEEARRYLALGYSLVMVSNDATIFGKAASHCVEQVRGS